ncbi:MAG: hypothetical protein AAFX94_22675, partial [Myxococcota bacterium]
IPPYSVRVGDRWFQYNRLEPLGMLMGLSADIAEAIQNWDGEDLNHGEAIAEMSTVALTVVTTNITDKTWFAGVSDLVQAIDDSKRYMKRWGQTLGTNVVLPYNSLLRRVAADHDENARLAWTFMDQLKVKIPGLRNTLAVRRDYLGNEVKQTDYVGPAWISPFVLGVENKDPVYSELARLEFDYRMPDRDIFNIGEKADAETYSEFLRLRGQSPQGGLTMQQALKQLFDSDAYRFDLTDLGRIEAVQRLVGRYTRAARIELLESRPNLQREVQRNRREAKEALLSRSGSPPIASTQQRQRGGLERARVALESLASSTSPTGGADIALEEARRALENLAAQAGGRSTLV